MLWASIFGPLGVALFAYGELRRRGIREPQPTADPAEDLDLPVQVNIEGNWLDGRLQTWSQGEGEWYGWVRYLVDGEHRAAWFTAQQVRRPEPAV